MERLFQTFQYGEAGRQLYEFFWSDFADWYVEIAKQQLQSEQTRGQTVLTLTRLLDTSLRLLHPFAPFVTEELWGHLRQAVLDSPIAALAGDWPEALIVARWPEPRAPEGWEDAKLADFSLLQDMVRALRNLRAEKKVAAGRRLPAIMAGGAKTSLLEEQASTISALSGLDAAQLKISPTLVKKPPESMALVIGPVEIHVPLAGLVDIEVERGRLSTELAASESQIKRLQQLLAGEFGHKAPASVVAKERERLAALQETAQRLKSQLAK
jgi:valyl-tRNA synthetase